MPGRIFKRLAGRTGRSSLPILLAALALGGTGCGARGSAPAARPAAGISAAEVLTQADRLRESGGLGEAARLYSWLLESFPYGSHTAPAQFGLARVQMLRGELAPAAAELAQFRLNFPGHPLSGLALLYISECAERLEREAPGPAARPPLARARQGALLPPEPSPPEPLLAAQVLLWHAPSWQALDREMAALRAAGFNAVIFRAFSNPGDRLYPFARITGPPVGIYFQSEHAPVVADVLGRVSELAHRNGLALYAWMTSRYADYGLSGERAELWRERTYDLATGAVLAGRGLDLFNDRVVDHLARLYEDLGRYPIDGLLFQDDLVSRHTEGFSAAAGRAYAQRFARALDPRDFYEGIYQPAGAPRPYVRRYSKSFWQWVEWKNQRLLGVAQRLADAVRQRRPRLKVAVNFMYEAASAPRNALAWLSQSISAAHRRRFDYYAVMAYHRQMEEELGLSLDQTLTLLRRMSRSLYAGAHPERALIKLQIRDWRSHQAVSREELERVVAAVREGAAGTGVAPNLAVVPYAGVSDLARLRAALSLGPAATGEGFGRRGLAWQGRP